MSNDYFIAPGIPEDFTRARGAPIAAQFAALEAAFAKLPARRDLFENTLNYVEATGSANTLLVSMQLAPVNYRDGLNLDVHIATTNTGPATINVNGLGAKAIQSNAGQALVGGELVAGAIVPMVYVGGVFRLPATGPQGPAGPPGATSGIVGPTGPQGPQGAQGAQGNPGTNGRTILSGAINPSGGIGTNGDYYINYATAFIFGPKAAGVWPTGVSIIGPAGPAGPPGTQDTSDITLTGENYVNSNEIGFRELPRSRATNVTVNVADGDRGQFIELTGSTAGQWVGIVQNSDTPIRNGAVITLVNNSTVSWGLLRGALSGGGNVTMKRAGSGADFDRTIPVGGYAWVHKISTNTWFCGGDVT